MFFNTGLTLRARGKTPNSTIVSSLALCGLVAYRPLTPERIVLYGSVACDARAAYRGFPELYSWYNEPKYTTEE